MANYNLNTLVLSDGTNEVLVFQDVSFSQDLTILTLTVPVNYVAPDADAGGGRNLLLYLQYDSATEKLSAGFFMGTEAGTVSEFVPDPQGLIFPWRLQVGPGTAEAVWVGSSVGLRADPTLLTFHFEPLAPGTTVHSELIVLDFGGNSDTTVVTAVVP